MLDIRPTLGEQMRGMVPALILALVMVMVTATLYKTDALAAIGGPASKHNMTEKAGYAFGGDVCSACHRPHFTSGVRLWAKDRNAGGDGRRDLATAKAASLDQASGPGNYPGIYLCLDCHGGTAGTPSWARDAKKVTTHSSREMAAAGYTVKYGSFVVQCTECHNTHQAWDGSFGTGVNGYMIGNTVRGRTVVFTGMTGPGSMGTNTSPYQAVCEVCHTKTSYHKNSGAADHHDGEDCSVCHSHSGGFAGKACNGCHGDPPVSYDTLVGRAANPGSAPTGSPTSGKHAFHVLSSSAAAGYTCKVCHRGGMGGGKNADKVIDVRFNALNTYTGGSFDGFSPVGGYTFSPNNTAGGTLACSNTYCHGNFTGGNTANKPVWDDASTGACGTCHAVAPPGLTNHSVHLSADWGPRAACDNCHPAGSNSGRHAGHVDGKVELKDGKDLAETTVCNVCHGCTPATKPTWGDATQRASTQWCEKCHNGSSTIKTAAGTSNWSVTAPNVVGDKLSYGYDVSGHGKTGVSLACTDCHATAGRHIDEKQQTYKASENNYKAAHRLAVSNTVPLLSGYSSTRIALCYNCHSEYKVVGMPTTGRPSGLHVHSVVPSGGVWYTDFRNMSTVKGWNAGNYDTSFSPGYDVPTNIHWNHLDDYGSTKRTGGTTLYDSDGDGTGDSYVTCETCHNPHGTRQPAMVHDDFSLQTYTLTGQPTYRWLGSDAYVNSRCAGVACHFSGDGTGPTGTKWYREPSGLGTTGVPLGLKIEPLP